jgi:anaerobic magnesium-protoporphyrin IX monomethyl ester cyclase
VSALVAESRVLAANHPFPLLRAESSEVVRDTSRPILLIEFQDQGHLGLGYLASTLKQHGYSVVTCDVESKPEEIVRTATKLDPMIFGCCFQKYLLA